MVIPQAVLLADGVVGPITTARVTVFLIDLLNGFPYRGFGLAGIMGVVNGDLTRFHCFPLCFEGRIKFIFGFPGLLADAVYHHNIAIAPIPIFKFVDACVILLCHVKSSCVVDFLWQ